MRAFLSHYGFFRVLAFLNVFPMLRGRDPAHKRRVPVTEKTELERELLLVSCMLYTLERGGTAFCQLVIDAKRAACFEEARDALAYFYNSEIYSPDETGEDDSDLSLLVDRIPDEGPLPEDIASEHSMMHAVKRSIDALRPRYARILALRFGLYGHHPHTLDEIGKDIGASRQRAEQIVLAALEKVRIHLEKEGFHELNMLL